jgi:hypothetical protein
MLLERAYAHLRRKNAIVEEVVVVVRLHFSHLLLKNKHAQYPYQHHGMLVVVSSYSYIQRSAKKARHKWVGTYIHNTNIVLTATRAGIKCIYIQISMTYDFLEPLDHASTNPAWDDDPAWVAVIGHQAHAVLRDKPC